MLDFHHNDNHYQIIESVEALFKVNDFLFKLVVWRLSLICVNNQLNEEILMHVKQLGEGETSKIITILEYFMQNWLRIYQCESCLGNKRIYSNLC